jgi:hypothetical protein
MEYSDPGSVQLPLTLPVPTSQAGEPLLELVENREYAVPLPTASASPTTYIPKVGSVNAVPPGRSSLIVLGGWPTFAFFAKVGAKVVRHRVFRFERVTLRLCPTIRDATTASAWKS